MIKYRKQNLCMDEKLIYLFPAVSEAESKVHYDNHQPLLIYTSAYTIIHKNMISGSKMLWSEQLCLIHSGLCLAMARSGSPCGKNVLCLSQDVCQTMINIKFYALFLLVWAGHHLC